MDTQEIEKEALKLDVQSRARLAEKLLHSLDDLSEGELAHLWVGEAQRRDAAMDSDPGRGVPAEEALREARSLVHPEHGSR